MSENSALTAKQFKDAITRILDYTLAKSALTNIDVLDDITLGDILNWNHSLIHIGEEQPTETDKFPIWVDTSTTPVIKFRSDSVGGAVKYVETTSGKSAYAVAVENGFEGSESEWLASLVGTGAKGETGEGAYESAQKGGYTGTRTDFYNLLANLGNISLGNVTFIHYGSEEPTDENLMYWADTAVSPAVWKYKDENGLWRTFAGGSGGSGGITSTVDMAIKPDWTEKSIAFGSDCELTFEWYSRNGGNHTGMGTFDLYNTTTGKEEKIDSYRISQSSDPEKVLKHSVKLKNHLVLGNNEFIIKVTDRYGTERSAIIAVTAVKLSLTPAFSSNVPYSSNPVTFRCVPEGGVNLKKNLYVYLDDSLAASIPFESSGATISTNLEITEHGVHKIRAYYTCELEEGVEPIPSEKIYCEFAFLKEGETEPIVVTDCGTEGMKQFESLPIKWWVFTPNGDGTASTYTPSVKIYENNIGNVLESESPKQTLSNISQGSLQEYPYKAETTGDNYILFQVGDYVRTLYVDVSANTITAKATQESLLLYLTSNKRSNSEDPEERKKWVYKDEGNGINYECELRNFNFTSDGWLPDSSGKSTVLRHRDSARTFIPIEIFTDSIRETGVTIEFELATLDVMDDDTEIITCLNGKNGLSVIAKEAKLILNGAPFSSQFREEKPVRVSFAIESVNTSTRLIQLYINGVMARARTFSTNEVFSQATPQGITIGSNLCTTDLYAIRVYNSYLDRRSILNNWIVDTQDAEEMINRDRRNNIYNVNNAVDINMLPENLPYLVIYAPGEEGEGNGLPTSKGQKLITSGSFTHPDPKKSFTFTDAVIKVQGTSSLGYPRKNYTLTFGDKGIIRASDGKVVHEFKMNDSAYPTNRFCFKADYASSEGANNVELVRLFNEIAPQIPPQLQDPKIRQGIDGFPMVVFRLDGDGNYHFLGKYNFNNDKGTPEVFGMVPGVESWEIANNSTLMGEYKEDDFHTLVYDKNTNTSDEKWKGTFEARYPEDNENLENLQKMVSWVKSTWRAEANPERGIEAVTYNGVTYEYDTEEYRKAKFINEVGKYFNKEHLIFFYLFTSFFLMGDNREKNTFPTRYLDGLWYFIPYDMDTALGINNSGELVFGFELEDTDAGVFNGEDSVLWCNVRDYFSDDIRDLYRELRNGSFNYENVSKRFTDHQRLWGEAIFNEDAYVKYISVMFGDNGTARYLSMLQGNKEGQRDYWLYNRFRFFDSKYLTHDSKSEIIIIRPNANADIVITPYTHTYLAINFDSMSGTKEPLPVKAYKGEPCTFVNPTATPENAVVHIYNASRISDLGDLSGQLTSEFDGRSAIRLQRLIIGSDDIVNAEFKVLTLGSNRLLKVVNVKNCINLGTEASAPTINLSGCSSIEEVYCENTKITACELPKGGSCRVLHLPETVTDLTVINHKITDFSMPSYSSLRQVNLDLNETSEGSFDIKKIINDIVDSLDKDNGEKGRLRVKNFHLTDDLSFSTGTEVLEWYKKIADNFKGLNSNGDPQDNIELTGVIEVEEGITGEQLVEMRSFFPDVEVKFKEIKFTIFFYPDKDKQRTPFALTIPDVDGDKLGDGHDPIATGEMAVPTKFANGDTEDSNFRYVFQGWDDDLQNVESIRNVHAVYREDKKYYRTFVDRFGDVLEVNGRENNVYYALPGECDIKQPPNPETWESVIDGIQYNNEFVGWVAVGGTDEPQMILPDIAEGDNFRVTYMPQYNAKRVYVVKYIDQEDSIELGETRHYYGDTLKTPETPVKERTNYEYFVFSHWVDSNGTTITDFSTIEVTADTVIYAVFTAHTINYKVVFKKPDGTVLQEVGGAKTYSENLGSLYTGATKWNPAYKTEELKGWKISTDFKNGVYYLIYTASIYTAEIVRLSVRNNNIGNDNPGEPRYVCDGDESSRHGFNIGVLRALQLHHYVRLRATLSNIPEGTIFNDVELKAVTYKAGYKEGSSVLTGNYTCRFMMYLEGFHYPTTETSSGSIKSISPDGYMFDANTSGHQTFTRNKSTLSGALDWMSKNIPLINAGELYATVEGSNIYVYEVYMTVYYTT